ncbi:hypothetical protein KC19_VG203300 [Ceratodon purpureus]|uniref:Uncharacterized protein n=1 Tax=Ceratodon purpureus TaxID=3225 RepID=A0A8T0HSD8_CERPU|nr:hypothetical protein KC19_VG203300 [Ceratodon purpureus]
MFLVDLHRILVAESMRSRAVARVLCSTLWRSSRFTRSSLQDLDLSLNDTYWASGAMRLIREDPSRHPPVTRGSDDHSPGLRNQLKMTGGVQRRSMNRKCPRIMSVSIQVHQRY